MSASGSAEAHANGQDGVDGDQDSDLVPWLVENKYYSAQVYFRLCEVDEVELWERGTEVVLYAFVDSVSRSRLSDSLATAELLTSR